MIVDAFTFFNEKELVELRIKYLNDVVDSFLIVEADHTHTGIKKNWNFPELLKNNLKQFSHKIQYNQMKVDLKKAEAEKNPNYIGKTLGRSWRVETMQRNFLKDSYQKISSGDDIIIISDLDEIPSKDKVDFIKSSDFKLIAPVAFVQSLFHLNCKFLDLEEWIGSVVITSKLIEKYEPQIFRDYKNRISRFIDGGWSFSSFGGAERVRLKLEAFCHEEYNKKEYKVEEHLKKCMETGLDLFKRKSNKKKIEENYFPKDLLKLMKENQSFYFGSNATI